MLLGHGYPINKLLYLSSFCLRYTAEYFRSFVICAYAVTKFLPAIILILFYRKADSKNI